MILCVMFQLVARCTWLCSSSTSQTSAAKMERKVGRNQCRYFISDWIVIKEIGRCWNVVTMSRRASYFYNQILFLCMNLIIVWIIPKLKPFQARSPGSCRRWWTRAWRWAGTRPSPATSHTARDTRWPINNVTYIQRGNIHVWCMYRVDQKKVCSQKTKLVKSYSKPCFANM